MSHRAACILLWSFLICCPASEVWGQETTIYVEDFDAVAAPELPPGWTASGAGWGTSDAAASSGSGENNLVHLGREAGAVTTPAIDLSGVVSGTVQYLARRTGTYDAQHLVVTASIDGGRAFSVPLLPAGSALPSESSSYERIEVALPEALLGERQVVLRFEAAGGNSGGSSARVDDLIIRGAMPVVVMPRQLAFLAGPGTVQEQSFTVANRSGAALQLEAPQVEGPAFSIAPSGAVTLADGASERYTVTFAPGADGSYSGSVSLRHDRGQARVALHGVTAGGRFGFSAAESTGLEESAVLDIPLVLDFSQAVPLQGLEFTVAWDDPVLAFVDVVRGPAVADAGVWDLAVEAGERALKVILLGTPGDGLRAQTYDPLLVLRVRSSALDGRDRQTIALALASVLGALDVPTGDDAGIVAGQAEHTVTLERRRAFLEASTAALNLGSVAVGDTATGTVTLSNPNGTRALSIDGVATSNARFSISPAAATVAPDAEVAFTVAFAPTMAAFGAQEGRLTFSHDGEGGPFELTATGTGLHGRGDADGDGRVDAVDLVVGVDVVLGRRGAAVLVQASLDLHPFPDGDEQVDVRDLAVLAQGIVSGAWPDGVALPVVVPGAGKAASPVGAEVAVAQAGQGLEIRVNAMVPLRALQVELEVDPLAGAPQVPGVEGGAWPAGTTLMAVGDVAQGRVRMLAVRLDGGVMPPGPYLLAILPPPPPRVAGYYATAVSEAGARLGVRVPTVPAPVATGEERLPDRFRLGRPYPNPVSASAGGAVRVSVALPSAGILHVALFDALGRRVALLHQAPHRAGRSLLQWPVRDDEGRPVPPGLYVLHARWETTVQTRPLVILP